MNRIRLALSFENVLVTVVAFAVISGGVAYGAGQLGKNTVGKKQLKANSVTAAKIKKNAITTAKIKKGALTAAKVKNGSLSAAVFNPATNPFSGVVATVTGAGAVTKDEPTIAPIAVPLSSNVFVQQPGEADYVVGQAQLEVTGACAKSSLIEVAVVYDAPDPSATSVGNHEIASALRFDLLGTEPDSETIPFQFDGTIPKPATATSRTLGAYFAGLCESGASSVTVSNVKLQVIGVRG